MELQISPQLLELLEQLESLLKDTNWLLKQYELVTLQEDEN